MHPNPRFHADDREGMLDFSGATGFAHLFAATPAGPMVVHAPVTRAGDALHFHVARANRIAPHLAGAALIASVAGAQGYVSPSWYERPGDQVPTWNFVCVEVEGVAAPLDEAALVAHLDALAAQHEPRVASDRPWTRAKMADAAFRALLGAIAGFALPADAVRGTTKLSQNKREGDRARVIAGLAASGNAALAAAMAGPASG